MKIGDRAARTRHVPMNSFGVLVGANQLIKQSNTFIPEGHLIQQTLLFRQVQPPEEFRADFGTARKQLGQPSGLMNQLALLNSPKSDKVLNSPRHYRKLLAEKASVRGTRILDFPGV